MDGNSVIMKNCKDLIKEEKYRNWMKGTLGLMQTGKAVCEYVNRKFSMYLQGTATLNNPTIQSYLTADEFSHFRDENSTLRYNLTKLIKLRSGTWQWTEICQRCRSILEKLLCLHKSPKLIHWKNSDDTRSLTPEWAIAKIFMPMGNENNMGPDDTDPSAIFIVLKMCELFMNPIRRININRVIDATNALFHSSDNLIEHHDLIEYFTYMENLITDALNDPDNDEDLKQSIDYSHRKITKLKESEMTMTLFEDAQKAMRIQRTAIYYKFEQSLCDNDPVQLQELLKLAEKLGSDLEFINNHFDDIKSQNLQIEELEKQVNDKNCKIEQLKSIRNSQQDELTKMEIDIKAKGVELEHLEEQLKEKSKECGGLQAIIADNNTKIRELEDKLNKRIMENEEKQDEITENNAKIRDLEERIIKITIQKDRLQEEILNNKEGLSVGRKENSELQEEISNSKAKIRDVQEKVNERIKENCELQEEIANKNATIRNLEVRYNDLTKENGELQEEISKTKVTNTELLHQNNNLERQLLKQKLEFTNISKKRDDIRQQLEYLQHKNELQRRQIDCLEWETVAISSGLAVTSLIFLGL